MLWTIGPKLYIAMLPPVLYTKTAHHLQFLPFDIEIVSTSSHVTARWIGVEHAATTGYSQRSELATSGVQEEDGRENFFI